MDLIKSKRTLFIIICSLVVIILGFFIIKSITKKSDGKTGIERFYGSAHLHQTFENGQLTPYDVDTVVPGKDTLVANLEKKGYTVTITTLTLSSGSTGEQVSAVKGEEKCSVVYGLSEADAEEVFHQYETKYPDDTFYILAQNVNYVYFFSSNKVFSAAGFKELSNVGVMFQNHGNY